MEPIDRINHVLALRGMTGAELTRTLGLSTAVYSQWNTKSTKPSKKNLIRVAEVLEVDPEYLISGDEKEKTANPTVDGLSDYDIKMLAWFHSLAPEQRKAILTLGGAPAELAEAPDHE